MKTNPNQDYSKAPGFTVKSPCGREWFVPLTAIIADYASFLQEADGLSNADALTKANANMSFMETWFHEQFSWSDVVHHGVLVKKADAAHVEAALNFYRDYSGQSPSNDCVSQLMPET